MTLRALPSLVPLLSLSLALGCARSKTQDSTISSDETFSVESFVDEALFKEVTQCNGLNGIGQADASDILQKCFNEAKGKRLELPAGTFIHNEPLVIEGPIMIKTAGLNRDDQPCGTSEGRCATLQAGPNLLDPSPKIVEDNVRNLGSIRFQGRSVIIEHIVFDGNRQNRLSTHAAEMCRSGKNYYGKISTMLAENVLVSGSLFKNALCGTGLEVHNGTKRVTIERSHFRANGENNRTNFWSDGLTVHNAEKLNVLQNQFSDNSDVQFVLGGCLSCLVQENTFTHSGDVSSYAFAELMIHAWPGGPGEYTGSLFRSNQIDCGEKKRCGYGILLGGDSWYPSTKASNIRVVGNSIKNAIIPFSADDLTGPAEIRENSISLFTPGKIRCHGTGAEMMNSLFNVSRNSAKYLSESSLSERNALLKKHGRSLVSENDYDGCIPTSNFVPTGGTILPEEGGGAQVPQPSTVPCGTLWAEGYLKRGEPLNSCSGKYSLVFQDDGNLVLYNNSLQQAIWNTGTQGKNATVAALQVDGNLVVYSGATPLWHSQTHGTPSAFLNVQEDGNLVIYSGTTAVWNSKTAGK